ncbi:hypothetical protein ABZT17_26765 [Streptomyces sp. NPDC005648]|uniref:hypothetical protein n=1 Tax=Streptomyces sp. NPDC005648 TaxID=3157044 RepID=UPI0033A5CA6C
MPEPLTTEYMQKTQQIIAAAPVGPWNVEPSTHGLPDQVGPIAFLETWADTERIPVVEFISHAREALPRYVGEVSRQQALIQTLEQRIRDLESGQDGGDRD